MRCFIVRAAVLLALLAGTGLAIAYSTGPPATRTGAPAVADIPAEALCTVCHLGSPVNDPNGSLEILDLPNSYTVDQVIPVRVRLSYANPAPDTFPDKWGFQLTAVQKANGRGVGTFATSPGLEIVAPSVTSVYKTRRYIEHGADTSSIYTGRPSPVEWTFTWTAPPGDSGLIYFFASGNAANGDGCSFCGGDHIFTASDSLLGPNATPVQARTWGAVKALYR